MRHDGDDDDDDDDNDDDGLLLEFYVLATSKVMSERVLTCTYGDKLKPFARFPPIHLVSHSESELPITKCMRTKTTPFMRRGTAVSAPLASILLGAQQWSTTAKACSCPLASLQLHTRKGVRMPVCACMCACVCRAGVGVDQGV